jgi:hypothetical protein
MVTPDGMRTRFSFALDQSAAVNSDETVTSVLLDSVTSTTLAPKIAA